MEKQEFLTRISTIGACEDEVQRRTLLSELSAEVEKDYDKITELTTQNTNLTTANEQIRSANMQLWLRLGESKDKPNQDNKPKSEDKPQKRSFDNLFDEKGNIK